MIKIVECQLFIVDFLVFVNKKLNDSKNIFLKTFIFFLLCHLYLSSSILMLDILLGLENDNS